MRDHVRLVLIILIGIIVISFFYYAIEVEATTTVTTTPNIIVSVQINSNSTSSVGWSGDKTLTAVKFFGVTSPYALVTLTKFGQVAAITQADAAGNFTFHLSALPIGTYDFNLFAEDRFRRFSLTTNFSLSLVAKSITTVENIFLTPTISISRRDIMPGQILMVFGETAPNSLMQVFLGNKLLDQMVYSDNNGFWQMELDSNVLNAGPQIIKVKALATNGLESNFSESLFFEVVPAPLPQGQCAGPDLNFDGRVNIFDLSILLSYWRQTNPSFSCVNINQDDTVDIVDFSILLYWWSENIR